MIGELVVDALVGSLGSLLKIGVSAPGIFLPDLSIGIM